MLRPLLAPVSLALLVLAAPAAADPVMRFTWGPTSSVVMQQDFAGPGTYTQTLSVTGLSGSVSRLQARITHGGYHGFDPADVWQPLYPINQPPMNPPLNDCLGSPFYVVTSGAAGAVTIPNATLTVEVFAYQGVTNFKTYSFTTLDLHIDPPLAADPGTVYAFATIEYHHQNSVVGDAPGGCHNAERPFCFVQQMASATVGGFTTPAVIETGVLAWQHAPDAFFCLNSVTPARPSTWGAVKTLYR